MFLLLFYSIFIPIPDLIQSERDQIAFPYFMDTKPIPNLNEVFQKYDTLTIKVVYPESKESIYYFVKRDIFEILEYEISENIELDLIPITDEINAYRQKKYFIRPDKKDSIYEKHFQFNYYDPRSLSVVSKERSISFLEFENKLDYVEVEEEWDEDELEYIIYEFETDDLGNIIYAENGSNYEQKKYRYIYIDNKLDSIFYTNTTKYEKNVQRWDNGLTTSYFIKYFYDNNNKLSKIKFLEGASIVFHNQPINGDELNNGVNIYQIKELSFEYENDTLVKMISKDEENEIIYSFTYNQDQLIDEILIKKLYSGIDYNEDIRYYFDYKN